MLTVGLYIVCFLLNWPEVGNNFAISISFCILYVLSLLMLSFFYGKSNCYIILVSVCFGIILLATALALVLKNYKSIGEYFLLAIPAIVFLSPFAPIINSLPIFEPPIGLIMFILLVYGLMFFAHRLGRTQKQGIAFRHK